MSRRTLQNSILLWEKTKQIFKMRIQIAVFGDMIDLILKIITFASVENENKNNGPESNENIWPY